MPTENIITILTSLGNTADEVFEHLKNKNIVGMRREKSVCPLAILLRNLGYDVFVGVDRFWLLPIDAPYNGIPLPPACKEFTAKILDPNFHKYDKVLHDRFPQWKDK